MKTKTTTMSMCERQTEYGTNEEWYANDLQLAAELGKGLLDRNLELEGSLRQQQALIEDQVQEIRALSRQSVALREVNESRQRVYEQLEAGIAELENTNQQLKEEVSSDKKRIKSLCQSVDALETKCLELQQLVDDFKASERLRKRRDRHKTTPLCASALNSQTEFVDCGDGPSTTVPLRRRHSFQDLDSQEDPEWAVRLRSTVSRLKCQLAKEETTCNDLRAQVQILEQENAQLLEQQKQLEEQRERLVFYHQAERLYWSCIHCRRSRTETQQVDEESDDSLLASSAETFSLVELEDGGLAYGDGESLNGTLLDTTALPVDRNRISLLSELDAQYRAIIKKYEDLMLSSGSPSLDASDCPPPESLMDDAKETDLFRSLSQQSEGDSSCSSGVSSFHEEEDEEGRLEDRAVQTELQQEIPEFRSGPPFKELFEEIFAVLKRSAPQPVVHLKESANKTTDKNLDISRTLTPNNRSSTTKVVLHRLPHAQRKVALPGHYCVPVPTLTGFPLFKLPGTHSYAQVVKMSPRLMVRSSFRK